MRFIVIGINDAAQSEKLGFRDEELAVIGEEIAQGSREPDTVISKIFNSIAEPNIDLNA